MRPADHEFPKENVQFLQRFWVACITEIGLKLRDFQLRRRERASWIQTYDSEGSRVWLTKELEEAVEL